MNEPLRCPKCGEIVSSGERMCPKCWAVLPYVSPEPEPDPEPIPNEPDILYSENKCKKCNADLPQGVKKCPECGKVVKSYKGILWIILLIIVALAFGVWLLRGKITSESDSKPELSSAQNVQSNTDSDSKLASNSKAEKKKKTVSPPDFAKANELRDFGKELIAVDATIPEGMETLRKAISLYVEIAEQAGDATLVSNQIEDTYASYEATLLKHKSMMEGSLSGGIYAQIMEELNDAVSFGEDLMAKGYTIDVSSLTETRDTFHKEYIKRMAEEFNSFTQRDMWSRTEAWKLISDTAGNMFDPAELDDPIRLRYVYALSWWIQRQLETEIGNGTITEKGAAIKIANQIEEMDYNPMMIQYYITYMNHSGEDCSEVEKAYQDIVDYLAQTQGIRLGEDIALDRFWYFNDFENYPVDSKNGVTSQNRQWIRERMKSVSFTK